MNLLITGGAGFIGSHVVRRFVKKYPSYRIFNLDALTYAGNLESISDIEKAENYAFIHGDITDMDLVQKTFRECKIDAVLHLAAESHVDRSIHEPAAFVRTNVVGTANLLSASLENWKGGKAGKFYHISTDEVYGSIVKGFFTENTPYDPRSPYSASKASSDHLVRAFGHTYGLYVVLSNCSNNYGPYQFPEKLIPLTIRNIAAGLPLPVYGKGENIRDWLWVEDHAAAIDLVFHKGARLETYNVGGSNEWKNIDVVNLICEIMDDRLGKKPGTSKELITFVKDRPGHDLRYAIDASKIRKELKWQPSLDFRKGLELTVDWYLANQNWMDHVTSGTYRDYYEKQYHGK